MRGSWTRKGRLFMLVATPLQDGTAHLDAKDAPCLPEAARRESVDSAVVKVAEVGFGIRSSRKYGDIWRPPEPLDPPGPTRYCGCAKEKQDRSEFQEKLFSEEEVPVHDSLGGPVPRPFHCSLKINSMRRAIFARRVPARRMLIMCACLTTR